jgi:putative phosphoribosyl transferase
MDDSSDRAGQDRFPFEHDPSPSGARWREPPREPDPASFRSRRDAGVALGQALSAFAQRADVIVLALTSSSVHVANEVARTLNVPLDIFLASTLTAPAHDQLAIGAVTTGGTVVLNRELMERLRLPASVVRDAVTRARADVDRRERTLRGDRPPLDPAGLTVLLVADSVATGAMMQSAIAALRRRGATRVICAIPVAPPEICSLLRRSADDVVCLYTPKPYYGAGAWFEDFREPPLEGTRAMLERDSAIGTRDSALAVESPSREPSPESRWPSPDDPD